jgi:glucose/arabinose dehydrogenase
MALVLALALLIDRSAAAPRNDGSVPLGFVRTVVATGLVSPTVIELLPDGRLLIGERSGRIWIVENGTLLPTPLIVLDSDSDTLEHGLAGLVSDPEFAQNGFLYAYYTTREPRNRVSRFTVTGDVADPTSEMVVWQNPHTAADIHHGGAICFGNDGTLYIATGDQDNSASSQDPTSNDGKILRLRTDGSVPPDNPFVGVPGYDPAIWALGLRNPFRISYDRDADQLWIGDVGGNSDDSWEEIDRGCAGANYGWPKQEGEFCYVGNCDGITFPVLDYRHDDPNYYYQNLHAAIVLGPVYRGNAFPDEYRGNLFFGDFVQRSLRRLMFGESGESLGDQIFSPSPDAETVVDIKVSATGSLYHLSYGYPWDPDSGILYRTDYTGGDDGAPVAIATATPSQGDPPLKVTLDGSQSFDPDQGPGPLTFAWDLGDGATDDQAVVEHNYPHRGEYIARLQVSDGQYTTPAPPLTITVGSRPQPVILEPAEGALYKCGDTIDFSGTADDAEDGTLPPSAFSWQVFLIHGDHAHPFLEVDGVTSGSFEIPTTGHPPEDTHFEIVLTVTDSDGLKTTVTVDILPRISILHFDTVPSGIAFLLDGEPMLTPRVYQSVVGFEHQLEALATIEFGGIGLAFLRWTDRGARVHTFVAPDPEQSPGRIASVKAMYQSAQRSPP